MVNILKRFDLNLLVALDVLLEERSVSRAAVRLSLSQPAMSATLSRLRISLGDELLVRSRGEMFLTARAAELRQPVKEVLQGISQVLKAHEAFDPTQFEGRFRIAATDIAASLLSPCLSSRFRQATPGGSIEFIALDRLRLHDWLRDDSVDAAIVVQGERDRFLESEQLLQDELVFVAASNHTLAGQREIGLEQILDYPLVGVSAADLILGSFVRSLEALGREWRPAITVSHFLIVPSIVCQSGFIGIMGRCVARTFGDLGAITILDAGIALPTIRYKLVWHRRYTHDLAHRWMRSLIRASVDDLSPSTK